MAGGPTPNRMPERPPRCQSRRAVLAALLSAVVAAAFLGDTRAAPHGGPIPEAVGADAGRAASGHPRSGVPVTPLPDETGADPERVATGGARPEDSVTPVPSEARTDSERTAGQAHVPEPVEPLPDETGADPEQVATGGARSEDSVTPVPSEAETAPERTAAGEARGPEPIEPVPDGAGTDPGKVATGGARSEDSVTPVPSEAETAPERAAADEARGPEPIEPAPDEAGTDPGKVATGGARSEDSVTPVPSEAETAPARMAAGEARGREPIKPIPEETGTDPEKVALGRALFHDPRLSKDNTKACVSCHDLGNGGDDGLRVSIGVEGKSGTINAPTVFNAGLNFTQFWDGRARTLEQQIDGPVQSPVELGSLWPEVIVKLHEHESYPRRFNALYPDGINRKNVKDALAEFMRSLVTPNSRFDRWLRGDDGALTALEAHGYALFKHYGCVSCHQGANVGGNMFQVFGVLNEYFRRRGNITDADFGRYNITGNPADRHAFKVPSLRMAALTAPYLHDGSAATLRDAVDAMFEFQLGREAPDEDKEAIVAFIKTLAGENKELDF